MKTVFSDIIESEYEQEYEVSKIVYEQPTLKIISEDGDQYNADIIDYAHPEDDN